MKDEMNQTPLITGVAKWTLCLFLFVMMLSLVSFGCEGKAVQFTIRYDRIQGLEQGAPVIFDGNAIGEVTNIAYGRDGFFEVTVRIRKGFENAATEYSRFFVTEGPQDETTKVLEMVLARKGGNPLKEGAVLEGSTEFSAFHAQMHDDLGNGLEDLKKRLKEFSNELRQVPDSDAFKNLEKELGRLAEEMERAGKETRERVEKEILPYLKRELEELREWFRHFGGDKDLKPREVRNMKLSTPQVRAA
jgi:hypothetical protein